jgi:hypothetical protein
MVGLEMDSGITLKGTTPTKIDGSLYCIKSQGIAVKK